MLGTAAKGKDGPMEEGSLSLSKLASTDGILLSTGSDICFRSP